MSTYKKGRSGTLKTKKDPLNPKNNLKIRYEEIEDVYSYANTLNEKDREWLERFVQEEIRANLKHPGEKLNDVNDPKVRSRIYDRNNHRNNCIMSRAKVHGTLESIHDLDLDNEELVDDSFD